LRNISNNTGKIVKLVLFAVIFFSSEKTPEKLTAGKMSDRPASSRDRFRSAPHLRGSRENNFGSALFFHKA